MIYPNYLNNFILSRYIFLENAIFPRCLLVENAIAPRCFQKYSRPFGTIGWI